jgi:hypothetical protein
MSQLGSRQALPLYRFYVAGDSPPQPATDTFGKVLSRRMIAHGRDGNNVFSPVFRIAIDSSHGWKP